jgi:hypothetical protein
MNPLWRSGIGDYTKAGERFGADMVFDSLGVDRRDTFVNADRNEKTMHDVVALTAMSREPSPFGREFDRLVPFRGEVAFSLKAVHDFDDGHVADTKSLGQVGDTTRAVHINDIGDGFDIIFGRFGRVVFACSLMCRRG